MLDSIRRHQRLVLLFLMLLIVPSFVIFGIHGWQDFAQGGNNVATVGGQQITRQEFDNAVQDQVQRMSQMFGDSIDVSKINTPALRQAILDNLIQQRLLTEQMLNKHLTASDAQVREAILAIPAIQQLRRPDGSIDLKAYEQLLAAQRLTPNQLDAQIRYELASRQIPENIQGSAWLPKAVAERFATLRAQQRDVQELVLPASAYAAKIKPTPDQLKAYYEQHKEAFKTPETAQISYVVLDPKNVQTAVPAPGDDTLKKLYEQQIDHFKVPEQRRVSHILIAVPRDATPAQRAAAKAKAQSILDEVRKHPDEFAKLAKQDSQDPGSAAKGGDLGYFGRDAMVKPFSDAAFNLKLNEISNLVQTDYGYHILMLTGIKPAQTQPFDQVKDQLLKEYQQKEQAKIYAKQADQLTNLVFDQPDSLQPVADKLHLKIQTADVQRTPNPALGADSPLNNPKLLKAIFSDDSLQKKHNTEAVDVGQGVLVSAHVTAYHPAAVPPLDKIETQVSSKYVSEQATAEAKKDGEAKLADLRKSASADGFGPVQTVSRDNPGKVAPAALSEIFKADATKLPAYAGVDLGNQGYAIYRINKVSQPAATPADASRTAAETQQLAQIIGQAEFDAYVADLRANTKVKINPNAIGAKTNQQQ
ncbi:MAG: SurA N-terminal domain-containing protein [Burkholderiales bacterium]|nr:SurA N-terminal domain-containing protein [Burkholderiales bacterium]